jgi:hypothetical protein
VHIPDKANAKKKRKRKGGRRKARRWVVEVTHSWLNRFRRLLEPIPIGGILYE